MRFELIFLLGRYGGDANRFLIVSVFVGQTMNRGGP